MSRVWTALLVLVCCVFVAGVSARQQGGDSKARAIKNPVPSTAASVNAGRTVYNTNCRHCHGIRLAGDGPLGSPNPKPSNLADDKWDHGATDGEIYSVIWNGPAPMSDMKAMKDTLKERDVWNVVNFIRSMGPKSASTK